MNKEAILASLKELILGLKNNPERFRSDPDYVRSWESKQLEINLSIKKLNSCDASWLNDEYGKWFNKELKPTIKDIPSEIKDKLLWK